MIRNLGMQFANSPIHQFTNSPIHQFTNSPIRIIVRSMLRMLRLAVLVAIVMGVASIRLSAETGQAAWLRYARLDAAVVQRTAGEIPRSIVTLESTPPIQKARDELVEGLHGLLGMDLEGVAQLPADGAVIVGTLARLRQTSPELLPNGALESDSFWLKTSTLN